MSNLRFPETLDGSTDPWVLFTTQTASYNRTTNEAQTTPSGESVALYFPTGHSVSDELNYDTEELGIVGSKINRFMEGGQDLNMDNVRRTASQIGASSRRLAAQSAGYGGAYDRYTKKVTNPQSFMLFNSPGMRSFSFSFTFIPQTETEAEAVPQIIRFFRKAAYPQELDTIEYKFPETFVISFQQSSDDIIRMPEVACNSINVTYNPNSMSYFRSGNRPVETTLELGFTELRPISKGLVEEGY